jgi:hypothetical protein
MFALSSSAALAEKLRASIELIAIVVARIAQMTFLKFVFKKQPPNQENIILIKLIYSVYISIYHNLEKINTYYKKLIFNTNFV